MGRSVIRDVAALSRFSVDELKAKWRSLHGTEPPAYNRKHLISHLAHSIQVAAYGGLSSAAKTRMAQILRERGEGAPAPRSRRKRTAVPIAGVTYRREWNGTVHEVEAADGGFIYEGRRYRSLTAVATEITGTHWNGRAFFGLAKTHSKQKKGQGTD